MDEIVETQSKVETTKVQAVGGEKVQASETTETVTRKVAIPKPVETVITETTTVEETN